eukprot:5429008-Prymnesium_polylepis.1
MGPFMHSCGQAGRYVRVKLPGSSRRIYLAEVYAYGVAPPGAPPPPSPPFTPPSAPPSPAIPPAPPVGTLSALSRASAQLSITYYAASRCIDDSLTTACATYTSTDPWLEIDLGALRQVEWVAIHQYTTSYYWTKLLEHEIYVSETSGTSMTLCSSQNAPVSAGPFMHSCGQAGRYVRLKLPGSSRVLYIAE